jgi:hypothetical protein
MNTISSAPASSAVESSCEKDVGIPIPRKGRASARKRLALLVVIKIDVLLGPLNLVFELGTSFLKLAHALAKALGQFWQLLRSEEEKNEHEDQNSF